MLLKDFSKMLPEDEVEIIVLIDSNGDDYKKLVKRYSKTINLRAEFFKRRMGSSRLRNYGLRISSGKYLIFLDDDIRLKSDFVSKCKESIKLYDAFCFRIDLPVDSRPSIVKKIHRLLPGKILVKGCFITGGFDLKHPKPLIEVDHFPGVFVIKREMVENLSFDEKLGKGNGYLDDTEFSYSSKKENKMKLYFITDYSVKHLRYPTGGNRVHDVTEWVSDRWLYYYWNHRAYFTKKHGFVFIPLASLIGFIEAIFISAITKKNHLLTFLKGWLNGLKENL
ncbi:MAG: glycosyltransferase [Archaeoglobus sp.]|nr:glycosyltransferase [Archaeoglobus sp.]